MGLVLRAAQAAPLSARPAAVAAPSGARPACAALLPEVLLRSEPGAQAALALASEDVLRYVWDSRYGSMLIEVSGDEVLVNGQRVERHRP
jgi:hypothetical protein